METRRENRPVSNIAANSLFTVDMKPPVGPSEKPRARDPPLPGFGNH